MGEFDYDNQRIFSYKFSENTFTDDDFRIDSISLMKKTLQTYSLLMRQAGLYQTAVLFCEQEIKVKTGLLQMG
jgi:hypothetical protein